MMNDDDKNEWSVFSDAIEEQNDEKIGSKLQRNTREVVTTIHSLIVSNCRH